ncbi:hypothetical protein HPP92_028251 [Vanilla planifolia]|uniref:Uncharacterized protein n=1 Tax=Vanilla planifolia TaxID=51239 RepID=A0A835U419_VANPL|nr:hypothetical protein HPP92_028251 [Vanilla planifolia]
MGLSAVSIHGDGHQSTVSWKTNSQAAVSRKPASRRGSSTISPRSSEEGGEAGDTLAGVAGSMAAAMAAAACTSRGERKRPRKRRGEIGEVEDGGGAFDVESRDVVRPRRHLRLRECPKPNARFLPRFSDLRNPFSPIPHPHSAEIGMFVLIPPSLLPCSAAGVAAIPLRKRGRERRR